MNEEKKHQSWQQGRSFDDPQRQEIVNIGGKVILGKAILKELDVSETCKKMGEK